MRAPSSETLRKLLLADNSVGVTLHENGNSITNFMSYDATPDHYVFMHGRDVLDEKRAKFAEDGYLALPRNKHGVFQTGQHPFTQKAMEMIEHYLSHDSIDERKRWLAAEIMPALSFERKLSKRLDAEYPGTYVLYEQAVREEKARRERIRNNADSMFDEPIEEIKRALELEPSAAAGLRAILQPKLEKYFDRVENPFLDDGSIDLALLKKVIIFSYREQQKESEAEARKRLEELASKGDLKAQEALDAPKEPELPPADEPLLVYGKLMTAIFGKISDATGKDMKHYDRFKQAQDEMFNDEYEAMKARGVFEHKAIEIIDANSKPPVPAKRKREFMEYLKRFDHDNQEIHNLATGWNISSRRDQMSAEELRDVGRHERAILHLATFTRHMGNPFRGRLAYEEGRLSHEIADNVPRHILADSIKQGIKLAMDVGDPIKSNGSIQGQYSNPQIMGGYIMQLYDHPMIKTSNEAFSDAGFIRSMGQLLRHEFRHYWNDRTGAMGHPDVEKVAQMDREHYLRYHDAIMTETPDDMQLKLRDDAMRALRSHNINELRSIIKRIDSINNEWVDTQYGRARGYSYDAMLTEEVLPRVDETSLDVGSKAVRLFFPESVRYLAKLDNDPLVGQKHTDDVLDRRKPKPMHRTGI